MDHDRGAAADPGEGGPAQGEAALRGQRSADLRDQHLAVPDHAVNVAGPYNQVRLREVAEGLQERIEQIPSVLEAQLSGGLEREVHVDVDVAKLKFYSAARRTLMSYSSWSSR